MLEGRSKPEFPELLLSIEDDGRAIHVAGNLCVDNVHALELALEEKDPAVNVILELSRLTFVDVAGIHAIAGAARRQNGGRLILESPTCWVLRLIELSGVDTLASVDIREGETT